VKIEALQSLRGLAAMMVVFGHGIHVVEAKDNALWWIEVYLFQPNAAVVFFYVLSGYVLGLSYRRNPDPWRFALSRAFRLLPVYWLAVLLAAWQQSITNTLDWSAATWFMQASANGQVSASSVIANLTAWEIGLNGPLWSVRVELLMIPILPAMVWYAARSSLRMDLAVLVGLTGLAVLNVEAALHNERTAFLAYLHCFYLGVILPKYRLRWPSLWAAAGVGGNLWMQYEATTGSILLGPMVIIDGFLFAPVVAWAATNPRWLTWRPLVWLGNVSFSLYAYSLPALLLTAVVVYAWAPPVSAATLSLLCPALSLVVLLPLAWLSFRYVELPMIGVGRSITNRM
jgi:peptidoglycan/LPS O-acetylase OafA/YrhL